MSFIINNEIVYADSANLDAFGRLRTSEPFTIRDISFLFDKQPLLVNEYTAGTASAVWLSSSTVEMSVGNSSGDTIIRQTREYIYYQPGKSQLIFCTGVLNTEGGVEGLVSRMGYFDDRAYISTGLTRGNGIFLQLSGQSLGIVKRYTSANTQYDVVIPQSEWNVDRFDGNGGEENPSYIDIDPSKSQIFVVDLEWLGVGRVRVGFNISGVTYYAHEFNHANLINSTYMNTGSLPVRYEFINTSGVSHTSKMIQICSSVQSEGGVVRTGKVLTADRGITTTTVSTTLTPMVSIRLRDLYNRGSLTPLAVSILNTTANRFIRWGVYLGTSITGPSWVNLTDTATQYDISASAVDISNAVLISSGYLTTSADASIAIDSLLKALSSIQGLQDIITLAGQSTTATASVLASLTFEEII